MQYNLKQIGLDVEVQTYARGVQIEKEQTRGAAFDFTNDGWGADYADPYDFINVLLSGDSAPGVEQQQHRVLQRSEVQQGDARGLAARRQRAQCSVRRARHRHHEERGSVGGYRNASNRDFVSARTGCYTFNPVFQIDLAAICIK